MRGRLGAALTVFEKENYRFKNWRHANAGSVVFAGCGFPSFFPKTFRALREELGGIRDVSVAIDCCGLPLAGLAGEGAARREMERVSRRFSACGAREVVPVCPNCAVAFSGGLRLPQKSIYAKLAELSSCGKLNVRNLTTPGAVFVPCPDRDGRVWLGDVMRFAGEGVFVCDCARCCGAAFEIARPEASLAAARGVLEAVARQCERAGIADPVVYTYCASCAGRLERARRRLAGEAAARVRVVHVLSALLGVDEAPAVRTALANRAKAALS